MFTRTTVTVTTASLEYLFNALEPYKVFKYLVQLFNVKSDYGGGVAGATCPPGTQVIGPRRDHTSPLVHILRAAGGSSRRHAVSPIAWMRDTAAKVEIKGF